MVNLNLHFSDENNELIEMPLNDESSEEDRLKVRNNIWKGKVWEKEP